MKDELKIRIEDEAAGTVYEEWILETEFLRRRKSDVRHSCRNESLAKAPSRVSTEESESLQ